MKRILLILFVSGILLPVFAQRTADLAITVVSPQDNSTILINEPYMLTVDVLNNGSETINIGDSLYIYVEINGETLLFQPGNVDYLIRTGNLISSGGGTYSFGSQSMFAMGFENTTNDICVTVLPKNASAPIVDGNTSDNTDCFTITVVDSAAELGELNDEATEIYPVPANQEVTFMKFVYSEFVTIVDLNGQVVQQKMMNNNSFSVADLQNGVYFVRYEDGQTMKSIRLIVSH